MKNTTIDEPTTIADRGRLTFIENPGRDVEIQNRHGQVLITVSQNDQLRIAEVFLGSDIIDGPMNLVRISAIMAWKEVKQ